MSYRSALVILADGVEEMEAVIAIDVMRRANMDVLVANLSNRDTVECSRGVNIKVDVCLADIVDNLFSVVVIPGGMQCATTLSKSLVVKEVLQRHHQVCNLVAAICAGPLVLAAHGIALGKRVTSHPSVEHKMRDYMFCNKNVVRDGNILTSKGPSTAFEFTLEIVEYITNSAIASNVRKELLL